MNEPLTPTAAKTLIIAILTAGGVITFSGHALDEMANDSHGAILLADIHATLRGGVVRPAELRNGTWRYRVETARIVVVVSFRDQFSAIRVVTAWRTR